MQSIIIRCALLGPATCLGVACLAAAQAPGLFAGIQRDNAIRPDQDGAKGEVKSIDLDSKQLGKKRQVKVYLPPGHDPKQKYPVVYAFDGLSNVATDLIEPLIASGKIPPIIIVGTASGPGKMRQMEYMPQVSPKHFEAHEKFFIEEVMPWAEREWGASPERQDRVLYGSSNSAPFVLTMANRHPAKFGHIFAMMVYGLPLVDFAKELKEQPKDPTRYILVAGSKDKHGVESNQKVEKLLTEKKFPVSSIIVEGGGHTHELNRKQLPGMLEATFGKKKTSEAWPQWRGPNRDGVSPATGLLEEWKEPPPLVWKAEGVGKGYAGTVVENGMVCTIGERDGKFVVSGVSDKDGKVIWTTEIVEKDVDKARDWNHTASTPTMDGERVYALTKGGFLACLKTATGEIVWQKSYKHDFGGVRPHFPYCESPLVDGDKLICTPLGNDAVMVALDKKNGKELWRCKTTFKNKSGYGSCYASAVISHGGGVKQYVQFVGEGVIGVHAETGKELWHHTGVAGASNICTPIVKGDYVYIPCGYYTGSALIKLTATGDGGVKAKQVYFVGINKLRTESGGAVLVGDHLYQSHYGPSCPQCVEFSTGKMLWEMKRSPGSGSAAVVYADGHVYFRYANGVTLLVAATPEKYQLKGQFKTPGPSGDCWAHPAISNGRLYLRNHDAIYCYDLRKK